MYAITKDYENMPRLEVSQSFLGLTAEEVNGKMAIVGWGYDAVGGHGINNMCTIILSGAYSGTYYGDSITGTPIYSFNPDYNLNRIITNRAFVNNANLKVTVIYRLPFRKTVNYANMLHIYLFEAPNRWAASSNPAVNIELINCDRYNSELDTYNGIYQRNTDDEPQPNDTWRLVQYENEWVIRMKFGINIDWNLPYLRNEIVFDLYKKPSGSPTYKIYSFPKHFFFFSSASLLLHNLLKISGDFPRGVSGYLYHLSHGNIDRKNSEDQSLTLKDTLSYYGKMLKAMFYNVAQRVVSIRQSRYTDE